MDIVFIDFCFSLILCLTALKFNKSKERNFMIGVYVIMSIILWCAILMRR